jgi:molybdopterin converting factor small subunit
MIEIHLYGKLRRFSGDIDPTSASIAKVAWQPNDTVRVIIDRLGIPHTELGSNKFLNGRYAGLETRVSDGDRLGLFPDDMQLLYKWYFAATVSPALTQSAASSAPKQSPSSGAPTEAAVPTQSIQESGPSGSGKQDEK